MTSFTHAPANPAGSYRLDGRASGRKPVEAEGVARPW